MEHPEPMVSIPGVADASICNPWLDTVKLPDGAAGGGFTWAPDATSRWLLLSLLTLLTTDGNAGTRVPAIDYCDPDGVVWMTHPAIATTPASSTNTYSWRSIAPVTAGSANDVLSDGLTPLWLPIGWQVKVRIHGVKAGDTLTQNKLVVLKAEHRRTDLVAHGGGSGS